MLIIKNDLNYDNVYITSIKKKNPSDFITQRQFNQYKK